MRMVYKSIKKMEPRPGLNYSTVYIVQDMDSRNTAYTELLEIVNSMLPVLESDTELRDWFENTPLKNFPRQNKQYRTALEIVMELLDEFTGTRTDGSPKDIARAPIDRWNRLFQDTEWQILLVKK